jgi:hypothetical protein
MTKPTTQDGWPAHFNITVRITPARDKRGKRRRGLFWAGMGNDAFITSRHPVRDVARYFLKYFGMPERVTLTARHDDDGPDFVVTSLGEAAKNKSQFDGPNVLPFKARERTS